MLKVFNCSKIIIIAIYQSIGSEYLELFLLSEVVVLCSKKRGKELPLKGESSLGLTGWRAERSRGKCAGDFSMQAPPYQYFTGGYSGNNLSALVT